MASINLKHGHQYVRFSARGAGHMNITRKGNTFEFEYEQPGRDYAGPATRFSDCGSITLTSEELAAIEAQPDADVSCLAHAIKGDCKASIKGDIIRFIRANTR